MVAEEFCVHQGSKYAVGDKWALIPCGRCSCLKGGRKQCTICPGYQYSKTVHDKRNEDKKAGTNPVVNVLDDDEDLTLVCAYAGHMYPVGQVKVTEDACNICICVEAGEWRCSSSLVCHTPKQ